MSLINLTWQNLKKSIADVIKPNENREITGQVLQDAIHAVIDNIGSKYSFLGIAIPITDPKTFEGDIAYLSTTVGVYVNMPNVVISQVGLYLILRTNGSWTVENLVSLSNTNEQLAETIRKTLYPSGVTAYLENQYITPTLSANVPTKIDLPFSYKYIQDFQSLSGGGLQFLKDSETTFKVFSTITIKPKKKNALIKYHIYKNGQAVSGLTIESKFSTDIDIVSMTLVGELKLLKQDIITTYLETDVTTAVTFIFNSSIVDEK